MSYSLKVAVADGVATVETTGEVPDGTFVVSGHEDDNSRQLGVTRQGVDGRYVEAASHTHYKETA